MKNMYYPLKEKDLMAMEKLIYQMKLDEKRRKKKLRLKQKVKKDLWLSYPSTFYNRLTVES